MRGVDLRSGLGMDELAQQSEDRLRVIGDCWAPLEVQ